MNNFRHTKSRLLPNDRIQMVSGLLTKRSNSHYLLLSLLMVKLTLLSVACQKAYLTQDEKQAPIERIDSLTYSIKIIKDSVFNNVKCLDLLVYESTGTQELVYKHRYSKLPPELVFSCRAGAKIVVAIANSAVTPGINTIGRYSTLKTLECYYQDDNPSCAIMSGECTTEGEEAAILLLPIMARVKLSYIANSLDDYTILESPRIRLGNLNSNAIVFGKDPYSPSATIDYGEWVELGYDIGLYPREPDICLYCYPNSDDYSPVKTFVEFECQIEGKKHLFEYVIESIKRNSLNLLKIRINSDYSCTVECSKPTQ